jgi:hypothetical protein
MFSLSFPQSLIFIDIKTAIFILSNHERHNRPPD